MKGILARLTVLATLAAVGVLTGCATLTESGDHSIGFFPIGVPDDYYNRVWRMTVTTDELIFKGPGLIPRARYNWSATAKQQYRWTLAATSTGSGGLTGMFLLPPGLVIAEGVPLLERGDIVDVYYRAEDETDYGKGKAPIILKRICAIKDESCLEQLRKTQGGRTSGMVIEGVYRDAANTKLSAPLKNLGCTFLWIGCHGELQSGG